MFWLKTKASLLSADRRTIFRDFDATLSGNSSAIVNYLAGDGEYSGQPPKSLDNY